jgi:5-methylcytosine-specific restriction endonuclease McrA
MARNSSTAFRKVARLVVARDGQICGICGHGGAITVDHIISAKDWPPGVPGLDNPDNLRAAHGSRGVGEHNPCHECDPTRWPNGRHCNQSKGAGTPVIPQEHHSRTW